ncbi:uncharacterized protein LOC110983428 [Acanthaster planci]|uniref:Uncharacterized protein LOC110983428 n=1 Tax=Acanthaster planci TaxID=133434 RepID=A0A8B7YYF4_ACAPL|nr:uncharacterized protein LOC110983428 [Acanthaster planci]XP_022098374.1 uncharacterized protein LOC110983428 [Acanthaster planci]
MNSLAPHQIMMIVMNCIALVLGAPGNILILRVYFGKPRKTSTHILIMGLALSDLVSLCFTFPLDVISWSREYQMEDKRAFCRVVGFCYHYFAQCSVLIMVAVAIDRYNAVCRPHQWKITAGRAQGVVVTCLLLSTVTSVGALFSYGIKTIETDAEKVYFESDSMTDRVNVTLCVRNVEDAFNKAMLVLHTIWFVLLFVVLTMAYLRIYLTIRKRVNAGVGVHEEGDTSRMRVVRPVIRFISHLTVVTNRSGSADSPSALQNDTESHGPVDDAAVHPELAIHSSNSPNTSAKASNETDVSCSPDEKTASLSGKNTNALARALLLAGDVPHRPVLPSTLQVEKTYPEAAASPKEDDNGPSALSPVKPLANLRTSTAWRKIVPSVVVAAENPQAGSVKRESTLDSDNSSNKTVTAPVAKVLQKRAAATAMNLKIQKTTTNMLLVAALTALLTWFPTIVIEVSIGDVHEWLIYEDDWLKILTCFMGWLFLFNFVTNPFVYSLMNSRFREDCGKSFRACKRGRKKAMHARGDK